MRCAATPSPDLFLRQEPVLDLVPLAGWGSTTSRRLRWTILQCYWIHCEWAAAISARPDPVWGKAIQTWFPTALMPM